MELVTSHFGDLHFEFFNNIVSKNTRISYETDIYQFYSFLKDNYPTIKSPTEVGVRQILAYKNHLGDLKYAPKTINRKLSSVSEYYQFLAGKGIIMVNPVKNIKRSSASVQTPTEALDDEEVALFFNRLEQEGSSLYKAALYIMFCTGIRRSEVVNIKVKDFVSENGSIFLNVTGKGGKEVTKLIPQWIYQHVLNHLELLKSSGETITRESFVMMLKRKSSCQVITSQSIYNYIKKISLEVGITKEISPHSLRATYITAAIESGMALHKIQEDAGHSNIATTMSYNKRRKAKNESPVNSISFLKRA